MSVIVRMASRPVLRIVACLLVTVVLLHIFQPWESFLVEDVFGEPEVEFAVLPLDHLSEGTVEEQKQQSTDLQSAGGVDEHVEDPVLASSTQVEEPGFAPTTETASQAAEIQIPEQDSGSKQLPELSVKAIEAKIAEDEEWRPDFPSLTGFFDGLRSLVPISQWKPQQDRPVEEWGHPVVENNGPAMQPIRINGSFAAGPGAVVPCYIDNAETIPAPDIFAFPGVPSDMPAPFFGDYEELGLRQDICYDRLGRFGPYGYSYGQEKGGQGLFTHAKNPEMDVAETMYNPIDYRHVNWGQAQKRCHEKNAHRFKQSNDAHAARSSSSIGRHAFVLRAWEDYDYTDAQILSIRAMVNELSLKSGGEYDVHLLIEIKNLTLPIYSSPEAYRQVLERNAPREFWNITTLWSEDLLRTYYSTDAFDHVPSFQQYDHGPLTAVRRSGHWPMQWFSQQHPEYEFYWNWEMDVRYTGHYYEFLNALSRWSDKQPRKGLWERNDKYWIPREHGSWDEFVTLIEESRAAGPEPPIWGPVKFENAQGLLNYPEGVIPPTTYEEDNYEWGVGEAADLITFNPIFDVAKSAWLLSDDVTGYDTDIQPPPRRCSVVAVTRMSKRLLNLMHEETWSKRHSMFPEVFPPSIALHYGLKAVYPPMPVHLDRSWNLAWLDRVFNWPTKEKENVFSFFGNTVPGFGEFNHLGSTFYFLAQFGGYMWRRWLGASENGVGGPEWEDENGGRMCLRGMVIHPVKSDGI